MPAISTKTGSPKHLRLIGVLTALTAGGLLLAGAATSQTITPQSVDPVQHFIDCAGVLITAPDIHAANCLPNNIPPEMNSLASSSDDDDCIAVDVVKDDDRHDPCYDIPRDGVLDNTEN